MHYTVAHVIRTPLRTALDDSNRAYSRRTANNRDLSYIVVRRRRSLIPGWAAYGRREYKSPHILTRWRRTRHRNLLITGCPVRNVDPRGPTFSALRRVILRASLAVACPPKQSRSRRSACCWRGPDCCQRGSCDERIGAGRGDLRCRRHRCPRGEKVIKGAC